MQVRKPIRVVACAAALTFAVGVPAATGAGAAGAPAPTKTAAASKLVANAAVSSAFAALQSASHFKSKAARELAVRQALQSLEARIKRATAGVKPSAFALSEQKSAAVRRAEKEMSHPGSVATGARSAEKSVATYGSGFQTSTNWSGYVDTNETYNYVFGEWTVPQANCGPWYNFNFSQSSTWVGLDGENSGTVEQLGTASGCIAGASAYYAWTEMYPQIENPIWHGIGPGDQMMSFVYSYGNNTQYELWMADLTQGWSEVRFASSSTPLTNSSAEWITERPTCGPFCNNLTNFGSTTFSSAYAMGNTGFGTISSFPNSADDMYTNTYCAVVGPLTNGGTQFTDWWTHS